MVAKSIAVQARLLDALGQAVIGTDVNGRIIYWNSCAEKLYGWTADEVLGRNILEITPAPGSSGAAAEIMELLKAGKSWSGEFEVHDRVGRAFPAQVTNSPILDESGTLVGVVGISEDISARKAAERHTELLLSELDHRLSNTLTTVLSIARDTARSTSTISEFVSSFEDRVLSLAKTHRLLTREHWETVSLRDLARSELGLFGADRYELEGEDVRLPPNVCLAIGMCLHELVTNSAKHGSLKMSNGRVCLSWKSVLHNSSPHLELAWLERGGPPVSSPSRRGFGSRLIRRLVERSLAGTVETAYEQHGLRCVIRFPREPKSHT